MSMQLPALPRDVPHTASGVVVEAEHRMDEVTTALQSALDDVSSIQENAQAAATRLHALLATMGAPQRG